MDNKMPIFLASMFCICLGNFLLVLLANLSPFSTVFVYFLIGTSCGAYLVTNMVNFQFYISNFNCQKMSGFTGRNFAQFQHSIIGRFVEWMAIRNGWHRPFGLFSAPLEIISFGCCHHLMHFCSRHCKFLFNLLLIHIFLDYFFQQYFAFESIPWLLHSGKTQKAQTVQQRLIGVIEYKFRRIT